MLKRVIEISANAGNTGAGGRGGPGAGGLRVMETPAGPIDGVNTTFLLSYEPAGPIHLYLNGVWQSPTDVAFAGPYITYTMPPRPPDDHTAIYPR